MDEQIIRLAIQTLDTEIQKEPQNARLYKERGRLYMMLGENEAAIQDIRHASAINPSLMEQIEGKYSI